MKLRNILALLFASALAQIVEIDPKISNATIPKTKGKYGGLPLPAHLKIRLSQGITQMFRENLLDYGRAYLNSDYEFADHGQFELVMPPIIFDFKYTNVKHAPIQIDMTNFAFDFSANHEGQQLKMQLPLIKNWTYECDYLAHIGFVFPLSGHMKLAMRKVSAHADVKLLATKNGILYPKLTSLHVDFGDSYIKAQKVSHLLFFNQGFNFLKYVIQDSINRFGLHLYNTALPAYLDYHLGSQQFEFPFKVPQLQKNGTFNIDYRLTADPVIKNKVMDLSFFFDIGAKKDPCSIKYDEFKYEFQNYDYRFLQVMMSDRVPNCLLQAMEKQDFFNIQLNSHKMANMFGTHKFPITMSLFSNAYPTLVTKYGANQELDLEIKIENPRVVFGPSSGENVRFYCDVKFGIKKLGSMNYLLYDQLHVESTFNLEISQEVLLSDVVTIDVSPGGENINRKDPLFADTDFTDQDYKQFWRYANFKVDEWFKYLNDEVLNVGVPLPYWKLSFLTALEFKPRALSAVIELFYNK